MEKERIKMPSVDIKGLKANCPKCKSDPKHIEMWNCGPIVYLRCPNCNFRLRDVDVVIGMRTMDRLINLWNEIERQVK